MDYVKIRVTLEATCLFYYCRSNILLPTATAYSWLAQKVNKRNCLFIHSATSTTSYFIMPFQWKNDDIERLLG